MDNTPPETEIRFQIERRGRITFAEFMDLALYHPRGGYYTNQSAFGAQGDYFTSPAAHPAFGALLATLLERMWESLGRPAMFPVVEMGAGTGLLARDVCGFARTLSTEFGEALRYLALERYAPRGYTDTPAGRVQDVVASGIPLRGVVGCLVSNELVDSFPVHRFQIDGGEVKEVYVTLDESKAFTEVLGEPSTPMLPERLANLGFPMPEGSRGEVNLEIRPWIREVAEAIDRGFVVTLDYGYDAGELYSPARSRGTLQTYYRHTEGGSPYQRVGKQDITSHVDFSLLELEGSASGLNAIAFLTQADFLRRLGFDDMLGRVRALSLGQRERDANIMAMRELVKPDGLGGFKVLIQEKNTGITGLDELRVPTSADGETFPEPPLMDSEHMPLLEGRYPHLGLELEDLWPFGERDQ